MFPWDTSNILGPMRLEKQVFDAHNSCWILHFLKLDFEFVDPMGFNQTAIMLIELSYSENLHMMIIKL